MADDPQSPAQSFTAERPQLPGKSIRSRLFAFLVNMMAIVARQISRDGFWMCRSFSSGADVCPQFSFL
jgi:hypothetical protein